MCIEEPASDEPHDFTLPAFSEFGFDIQAASSEGLSRAVSKGRVVLTLER